jgi:hypothetical protein
MGANSSTPGDENKINRQNASNDLDQIVVKPSDPESAPSNTVTENAPSAPSNTGAESEASKTDTKDAKNTTNPVTVGGKKRKTKKNKKNKNKSRKNKNKSKKSKK